MALILLISRRIMRTSSVLLIIVAVDISTLVKSQSFSEIINMNQFLDDHLILKGCMCVIVSAC